MTRSRLIDRFEAEAESCGSDTALHALLDAAARELGFSHFALLHHASLRASGAGLIRIDSYPEGWTRLLLARLGAEDDPVHLASGRTPVGFGWAELGRLILLTPAHRALFEAARRHGLGDGFTVPVNVPGEPCGSCSFVMRPGRALPERRLLCAEQIGAHAFQAARRIHHYPLLRAPPHLSRRERQCLHLLAAGKTDWEIGQILGIGEETVHHYVKSARAAYDVVTRAQLVACGLRDAWISFDQALPFAGRPGAAVRAGAARGAAAKADRRRGAGCSGRAAPGA